MISRSAFGKATLIGATLTLAGAAYSLLYPNAPNYIFEPGMMLVYVLSGGVHGYSSGVYLPSLPVWYALGGIVNAAIYSLLVFVVLRRLRRKDKSGSL